VSWVRGPVAAVRKPLAVALLGPAATVLLLAPTCGTRDESVDRSSVVVPIGSIVPLSGGSHLPDPAQVLLRKADHDLKTGNFDAAARAAESAREGADPATKCIADAIQGVADINRKNTEAGLQELQRGECAINVVPDDVRVVMATLIENAKFVGYMRYGDEAAANRALENALRADPNRADVIVKEFCRTVKEPGSIKRCAGIPITAPRGTTTHTLSNTPTSTPTSTGPTTRRSPTTTAPRSTLTTSPTSTRPTSRSPTTTTANPPASDSTSTNPSR
jgi:hypothetical protein